jgi:CRISPR/Cas system-associated exonuclease Cas4 (RecB family)
MHSLTKQYNPKTLGKGNEILLMEHEYDMELPQTIEQVIQENENNFKTFVLWATQNQIVKKINESKKYWIEPDLFKKDSSSFLLKGKKIFAKVDLAILNSDDTFDIFDWKSGKSRKTSYWDMDSDELQMSVYQLWPHFQLNQSFDTIHAHLIYFGENPFKHNYFSMDENKKELIVQLVNNSITRVEKFERLLEDEENPIKHFDFASSGRICYNCVYKRICRRDIET